MADWLGLDRIVVEGRGELAPALRAAVGHDAPGDRPRLTPQEAVMDRPGRWADP